MLNLVLSLVLSVAAPSDVVSVYIEKYFELFPSKATEAGRHDRDKQLESLTPERLKAWVDFNRKTVESLNAELASTTLSPDDRLDAELLLSQAQWQLLELATLERASRDPLYWTIIASNAHSIA